MTMVKAKELSHIHTYTHTENMEKWMEDSQMCTQTGEILINILIKKFTNTRMASDRSIPIQTAQRHKTE